MLKSHTLQLLLLHKPFQVASCLVMFGSHDKVGRTYCPLQMHLVTIVPVGFVRVVKVLTIRVPPNLMVRNITNVIAA